MRTRRIRLTALLVISPLLAVACAGGSGGDDAGGGAGGESGEPLRVAVITSLSGQFAAVGEEVNQAADLAVEQINATGGVNGQPVEIVKIETDGAPATTIERVERAVTREGAPFVTGIVTSAEILAAMPRMEALNGVLISTNSKADDIIRVCNPRTFEIAQTNAMSIEAISGSLDAMPAKSFSIIAGDYVTGQQAAAAFAEAARAAGREVFEPIFVPLGTTEFGPQIAQLRDQGAEGLFSVVFGGDAVALVRQAEQFDLLGQYNTVAGMTFVIEPVFPAMGQAVVGTFGNIGYHHTLDTPANKEFVAAWGEKYGGDTPSFVGGDLHLGLQTLFAAAEAAGSNEPGAVSDAMRQVQLEDSTSGPVSIRPEDGLMLRPEYIGQVVAEGEGITWEIQSTVPAEEIVPPVACG